MSSLQLVLPRPLPRDISGLRPCATLRERQTQPDFHTNNLYFSCLGLFTCYEKSSSMSGEILGEILEQK